MVRSPLALRWDRAKAIPGQDVLVREVQHIGDYVVAMGWVRSQTEKKYRPQEAIGYGQVALFNQQGKLVGCQCLKGPDFVSTELKGDGEPLLRGIRVCKHALAFAMAAQEMINELL